jgi:hypothetical protein
MLQEKEVLVVQTVVLLLEKVEHMAVVEQVAMRYLMVHMAMDQMV